MTVHRGPLVGKQAQLPHIVEVVGINAELVAPRLGDDFVEVFVRGGVKLLSLQTDPSVEQRLNQDGLITR
jgi:hypothetical protein